MRWLTFLVSFTAGIFARDRRFWAGAQHLPVELSAALERHVSNSTGRQAISQTIANAFDLAF
jgi:hypothetical protein